MGKLIEFLHALSIVLVYSNRDDRCTAVDELSKDKTIEVFCSKKIGQAKMVQRESSRLCKFIGAAEEQHEFADTELHCIHEEGAQMIMTGFPFYDSRMYLPHQASAFVSFEIAV